MMGSRPRPYYEDEYYDERQYAPRPQKKSPKPKGKPSANWDVRTVGNADRTLIMIVVMLVLIGVVMVFSASHMNTATRAVFGHDPFWFLRRNAIFAVVGFGVMALTSKIDYWMYKGIVWVIYGVAIVLLLAVMVFGMAAGGATRWLIIPGIDFQFQPSELARAAVIFTMAYMADKFPKALDNWGGFFIFASLVGAMVVLIAIPGGFTTALITAAIGFGMIFIASPYLWRFVGIGLLGVGSVAGYLGLQALYGEGQGAFRGGRVNAWLDPFSDHLGLGFQTIQSLYAIASGGLFGLGIGNSRQASFVPEPHNDIIFAIVVEEIGLVGAGIILVLFGLFIWRGILAALNAPDTFGAMVALGIVFAIAVPTIINVAVVTNTIPNTGVNLPFISYGGTSLLVSMALAGILLNISKYSQTK